VAGFPAWRRAFHGLAQDTIAREQRARPIIACRERKLARSTVIDTPR